MPKKVIDYFIKEVKAVTKPIVKDIQIRHQRAMSTTREVLGFFVCQKCGYHQPEAFGACPKCRHPRSGLYVPKKK